MTNGDSLRMALSNLGRRKGRTLLTTAGVVIGTGALVLMISLGVGLQRESEKIFSTENSIRTLYITRPMSATKGKGKKPPPDIFGMNMPAILMGAKEIAEIRKMEGVDAVVPDLALALNAEIDEDEDNTVYMQFIVGAPPEDDALLREALVKGSLWSSPEERSVVIPSIIVKSRFSKEIDTVIGKEIYFTRSLLEDDVPLPKESDVTFKIVGVIDSEKIGLRRVAIHMPLAVAEQLRETMQGGNIPFQYKKGQYARLEVRAKTAEAVGALQTRLKNLGYEVTSLADLVGALNTFFLVINGFLACIGAIGLIVALLGIANTMATAVLERTREIGILKALGARNRDVRRVFLLEAAGIGAAGGLAGLVGAYVAGVVLNAVAHGAFNLPSEVKLFHVSILLAVGALSFSMVVSMAAGLVPAIRASRLDPVRALRYE